MTVEGISLRLIDTAGIRDTQDTVEALGVERARDYINKADIVLCVIDGSTLLTPEEIEILTSVSVWTLSYSSISPMWHKSLQTKISKNTVLLQLLNASVPKKAKGSAVLSKWVQELVYGGRVKQVQQRHD